MNHIFHKSLLPFFVVFILFFLISCTSKFNPDGKQISKSIIHADKLIQLSNDGSHFVYEKSDTKFIPWGFNYDRDDSGRLLEDYWEEEWETVVSDFKEMKFLGANIVRIHLQFGKFLISPDRINDKSIKQLIKLVKLAEKTGLYLDITGLACYHKKDVPDWYDSMTEIQRWNTQSLFWEAVSKACSDSNAVFCYDLINEPVLPGENEKVKEWLTGELAGKFYVQYITLDLAGRTKEQVAQAWVDKLVTSIRKNDSRHMITVGVIPWSYVFPGAKPIFYSEKACKNLSFVSVHFYPKKGEVDKALKALKVYDIGKPIVIEEIFPLACSIEELNEFIDGSKKFAEGWIGFYWGKTIEEYAKNQNDMYSAIVKIWLEYFKKKTSDIFQPSP